MPFGRTSVKRLPDKIVWEYKPTARQLLFHREPARFKLYGGAVGGAKSYALCAEAIKLSLKFPGNRGYFCRHESITFKKSTFVTFWRVCPEALVKKHWESKQVILFRNGSEIWYGGLGGEEDREKIKSTEFGWFAIDEATETIEDNFHMLDSRLRWTLPDGTHPKYHGLLASNPEPGWVKERFVNKRLADHAFIPALPKDNPYLPKGYYEGLRGRWPDEWVRRYLDGSWDVFEGQIYHEFDRAKHVYGGMEVGDHWERFQVVDHGYTNPTCFLWIAIDHDGVMWIYDEHYERQLTIPEHAAIAIGKDPGLTKRVNLCDPSMMNKTMQKGNQPWSPADEYLEHGIVLIKPYASDQGLIPEGMGIQLVKQRLKAGTLKIHERCVNTIDEMVKYRWRDLKPRAQATSNAPEIPVDKDNHAMDNIRYACMWRPPSAAVPQIPLNPNSIHAVIMKHKKRLQGPFYVGWN